MKQIEQIGKILLVILLSTSCSVMTPVSTVYFQENPQTPKQRWPTIHEDFASFSIDIQPFEKVDEALIFGVAVSNHGSQPLYLDPNSWRIHFRDTAVEEVLISPMDAYQIAQSFQNEANAIETSEKNRRTIIAVAAVVFIVGLVVLFANSGFVEEAAEESVDFEVNGLINNSVSVGFSYYHSPNVGINRPVAAKEKIQYYRREAERFENITITPTWVEPGESISFDLFFDRREIKDAFQLVGTIDEEDLSYRFVHQLHQ